MNRFDPFYIEIDRVFNRYPELSDNNRKLLIKSFRTHGGFIMPVTPNEIRQELSCVPKHFLGGLKGVFLLGGSRQQEKVTKSLFVFGRYTSNVIFLHPYPKAHMRQIYKKHPKPSILAEYERAGAHIHRSGKGCEIRFDEASLKKFYLRDVLMHELGHHVDRENLKTKTHGKKEGFAEWFASEYGFRLRFQRRDF